MESSIEDKRENEKGIFNVLAISFVHFFLLVLLPLQRSTAIIHKMMKIPSHSFHILRVLYRDGVEVEYFVHSLSMDFAEIQTLELERSVFVRVCVSIFLYRNFSCTHNSLLCFSFIYDDLKAHEKTNKYKPLAPFFDYKSPNQQQNVTRFCTQKQYPNCSYRLQLCYPCLQTDLICILFDKLNFMNFMNETYCVLIKIGRFQ